TRGVNRSRDQRRTGALRKQTRQRRSGCQSSEKRRPKAVITSVLVGQNTDTASGAQQLNDRLESILPPEQLQASLAACSAHMLIDETIAKFLIDARISHEPDKLRHQLRE